MSESGHTTPEQIPLLKRVENVQSHRCEICGKHGKTIKYCLALLLSVLFVCFLIPIPVETDDWYYFHVQECLEAHRHNMTFLYCSGFWREPHPSDFDNPVAIHPLENPWEEIPHGSCIVGNMRVEIVFGIYGWLTYK